jgi:hypothetical protein
VTVLSTIDDVAGERFVSLTTFRRDGTPVATPVWIARDGDALVVTTPADSGKVKRLRSTGSSPRSSAWCAADGSG